MASDTIVAISTPAGRGGIGIVRISGPATRSVTERLTSRRPAPREACFTQFRDARGERVDSGLVIWFPGPHSYTGEDVAELHAHGNPIILDQLVRLACAAGARVARPGEFTERAFRNGKLDLAQAEAVADVIASQTERAARSAQRTLAGAFGAAVNAVIGSIRHARAELEASIDFADDLTAADLVDRQHDHLAHILADLDRILAAACQGARLLAGAAIAIVGAPNVGKSSLLNRLAESERAIVSEVPGTARDVVAADIVIDGIPLRLLDTAGLRVPGDAIEREGIRRAHGALEAADLAILVTDDMHECDPPTLWRRLDRQTPPTVATLVVHNKIDLHGERARVEGTAAQLHVYASACSGEGIAALARAIAQALGVDPQTETEFTARTRHLEALAAARADIVAVDHAILAASPEIVAEHYRAASAALDAIAGRYTSEDLLGDIFSRFCIGK